MSLLDQSSIIIPKGFAVKSGNLAAWNPQNDSLVEFSVTRATTATRINESGLVESVGTNVARRDFEISSCGELLIEPQRTNVVTYSEDLTNAEWVTSLGATVDGNAGTAPDGNTTADRINLSSDANSRVENQVSITNGVAYTISVWLKSESGSVDVRVIASNLNQIVTVTEDWQRFKLTATSNSTIAFPQIRNSSASAKSVLAWGFQYEQGSYATSYIPNSTSGTVTRNADVLELTSAGSLLNDTVGGVYWEWSFLGETTGLVSLNSGTFTNSVQLGYIGGSAFYRLIVGGTTEGSGSGTAVSANTFYKQAFRYKANDLAGYFNGSSDFTDATANVFPASTINTVRFSGGSTGNTPFYGRIREFVVFDTEPTNAQLAAITTP